MNPSEWKEVSELLADLLAVEPAARTRLLEERCAGNASLRREVEALLATETSGGPLDRSPVEAALQANGRLRDGERLGPYRLLRAIGEGGMGVVYLARRDDGQFERNVAIKFIRHVLRGEPLLKRFATERQVLARLDHEHITRLLDAGVTAEGAPYLVMELVEGRPLTEVCRGLPLEQRLDLFRRICSAVEYAHQRLVVHRDLKPANILVQEDGQPKILDFGVAKLMEEDAASDTKALGRALTLNYASPELIRGEPVSTLADVYSLGVILFELLTGRVPHDYSNLTLDAVVREIESDSAAIPGYKGDLDAITAKATEKDPRRRYPSAQALAEDIRRYLNGEPVSARRASHAYLAGKFVRRNWRSVAAAAVFLIAVCGSAMLAERERARATRRFDQVRKLAGSMLFEFHDQAAKLSGSLELRHTMMSRAIEYLDSVAAEASGDRDLLMELAMAYVRWGSTQGYRESENYGDWKGALVSYGKARKLLDEIRTLAPGDLDASIRYGRLLSLIAQVYPTITERVAKKAAAGEAQAYWQELRRRHPEDDQVQQGLGSALFTLASIESTTAGRRGRYEEALDVFARSLARQPNHPDRLRNVALAHKYLAGTAEEADLDAFLEHVSQAQQLDARRVALAPTDRRARLDLTYDISMLATYHAKLREYGPAAGLAAQVVKEREALLAAEPKDVTLRSTYASALYQLGAHQMTLGDWRAARQSTASAAREYETLVRQGSGWQADLGWAVLNQARIARETGDSAACPQFLRARSLLGPLFAADVSRTALEQESWAVLRREAMSCQARPAAGN